MIDGPQSVIYDEAENRLHIQKAIMAVLMGGEALGDSLGAALAAGAA